MNITLPPLRTPGSARCLRLQVSWADHLSHRCLTKFIINVCMIFYVVFLFGSIITWISMFVYSFFDNGCFFCFLYLSWIKDPRSSKCYIYKRETNSFLKSPSRKQIENLWFLYPFWQDVDWLYFQNGFQKPTTRIPFSNIEAIVLGFCFILWI